MRRLAMACGLLLGLIVSGCYQPTGMVQVSLVIHSVRPNMPYIGPPVCPYCATFRIARQQAWQKVLDENTYTSTLTDQRNRPVHFVKDHHPRPDTLFPDAVPLIQVMHPVGSVTQTIEHVPIGQVVVRAAIQSPYLKGVDMFMLSDPVEVRVGDVTHVKLEMEVDPMSKAWGPSG